MKYVLDSNSLVTDNDIENIVVAEISCSNVWMWDFS